MNKKMFIPGCLALLSLALAACGEQTSSTPEPSVPTPTHTHTWETEWKSDGTNHWHACTDTSCDEVNGKVAHSGGTATCQEKAKCEVCEAEYGELAGHNYSETWTCSAEGHYKECTTEGCDAKTETTAHSGGTATCKAKGTCSECGEAYGEFAAHTWEEAVNADFLASKATCTTKATYYKSCAVCGETSDETFEGGELLPHSGGTATCTSKAVCDVCEQPYGELAAHTPGAEATQDTPQVCTVCGYIITPALGHTEANPKAEWSADDTYHWHDCQGCNEHITGKEEHSGGTATTTSRAVCTVCGKEYGEKLEILPYDNYTIKVNGVENTQASVAPTGTNFAQFELTLSVGDVVTVLGNETLLVFSALENATEFAATVEGTHTFYVNNENEVAVTTPTSGGGDVNPEGLVLYLVPNSNWTSDGARFAAYFFGNGETWVDMTDSNSDGIYEVVAPEGYPSVIFCRMNPASTDNQWGTDGSHKWNQTADLTVPSDDKVKYTVEPNTWDKGAGAWSKLDEQPTFEEKPVDNNWYLRGTVTGWEALDQYVLTQDGEQYTITIDLKANDEVKFSLSKEWNTAYGYANLEEGCKNLVSGTDNIVITTAGTYTFYIKPATESIWVAIAGEEHTHEESSTWTVEGNQHYKTCSGCDEKLYLGTHEGGTATCEAKAVCTVCNTAYGELAAHTEVVDAAVAATCTEKGKTEGKHCSVCEEVLVAQEEVPALGHTGGTATCEAKAVCTVCETAYGELADHVYGDLVVGTANSCDEEGTLSHYYCSVCNKYFTEAKVETTWDNLQVSAAGHSYGELVAAAEASCTEDGHAAYYQCSVCKEYFTEEKEETTLEALTVKAGHSYGELVAAVGATCTEDGHAAYYYCSVCETYFTEEKEETTLEALTIKAGHSYGELVAAVGATCTEDGHAAYYYCSVCNTYFTEEKEETTLEALTVKAMHAWEYENGSVTSLPSPVATGTFVIGCANCDEEETMVLPLYNNDNYTTTFEVVGVKAQYALALTASAVEAIVEENTVLDDDSLTTALSSFKQYLNPNDLGKTYSVVVNGQLVDATFVDNRVSVELAKNQTVKFYNNDTQIGTWTATVAETYTFVKDAQDKVTVEAKLVKYFLVPNSTWKANNNRFAAYHWDGAGKDGWTSMVWSSGDNAYVAEIDVTVWKNIIFCAMKGTALDNNWNNKVQQTADLLLTSGNKYTINGTSGSWSTVVPHEHSLVEGLVQGTDTHYQTCENCEDKVNEVAHVYNQTVTEGYLATEATCTSEATYYYSCICGAAGTETFEGEGTILEHDFDEENYLSSVEGHWFKCKDCDATSEVVAHNPNVEEATEETAKVCTVCEYVIQAALSHEHVNSDDYSKDETGHWYTCVATNPCDDALEFAEHTWVENTEVANSLKSEATCIAPAVYYKSCEVCGYVSTTLTFESGEVNPENHNEASELSKDDTYHWYECTLCNEDLNKEEHVGQSAATFTSASICECGHEVEAKITSVTINYYNSNDWGVVKVWIWNGSGANYSGGTWPGIQINPNTTLGDKWYSITLENKDLAGLQVIFNNGSGTQTKDITVKAGYTYFYGTNVEGFESVEKVMENLGTAPSWYVRGTINEWTGSDQYKLTQQDSEYVITLDLEVGAKIKFVTDPSSWENVDIYGYDNVENQDTVDVDDDRNIVIKKAGSYTFYLKPDQGKIWIEAPQ